jgi:hypothetical protein
VLHCSGSPVVATPMLGCVQVSGCSVSRNFLSTFVWPPHAMNAAQSCPSRLHLPAAFHCPAASPGSLEHSSAATSAWPCIAAACSRMRCEELRSVGMICCAAASAALNSALTDAMHPSAAAGHKGVRWPLVLHRQQALDHWQLACSCCSSRGQYQELQHHCCNGTA